MKFLFSRKRKNHGLVLLCPSLYINVFCLGSSFDCCGTVLYLSFSFSLSLVVFFRPLFFLFSFYYDILSVFMHFVFFASNNISMTPTHQHTHQHTHKHIYKHTHVRTNTHRYTNIFFAIYPSIKKEQ